MNQLPDALPGPGSALLTQVPNLFYGLIQFGHLSSSALAARQLLLPFPQYSTVNVSGTGYGTSSYQSFQAKFEKHLAQGGTLLVSYTFAKLLSDADTALGQTESGTGDVAAVQDWNNIRGSYSLASQNYRETPETWLSGWFNTACFTQPPAFTFGNESRTDPTLRMQGISNFDFVLFKNTAFGPEQKLGLEFRTEVFNLFNTPQFGPPGQTFGTAQFGVISSQVNNPRLIQFSLRLKF